MVINKSHSPIAESISSDVLKRPLISFILFAYQQEDFIEDAVRGVLEQTYSPLEIILSDDCSSDRTFDIMQEIVSHYHGPHRVVLNQNSENLGIGQHVNSLVEKCRGELILLAAGDDISFPNRTTTTYEIWQKSSKMATSIHSDYIQIDAKGRIIERIIKPSSGNTSHSSGVAEVQPAEYVRLLQPEVVGCTHAFSPRLFEAFGVLPVETTHEDAILTFRSVLVGSIEYIKTPLVKYRVHSSNVFLRESDHSLTIERLELQRQRTSKDLRTRISMYKAFAIDLEHGVSSGILSYSDKEIERAMTQISEMKQQLQLKQAFLEQSFVVRCRTAVQYRKFGYDVRVIKYFLKTAIPDKLLLALLTIRQFVGSKLGFYRDIRA